MNRTNTLIVLAIAGTGLLAACGGDDPSTPAVAAAPAPAVASVPPATTTTTAAAGSTVAVKNAESELGPILVGVDGRTLYGFTNDTPTQSNCEGTCAEAWPPVVVPANWTVAPGVDSGIFNTITRPTARCSSSPASTRCTPTRATPHPVTSTARVRATCGSSSTPPAR